MSWCESSTCCFKHSYLSFLLNDVRYGFTADSNVSWNCYNCPNLCCFFKVQFWKLFYMSERMRFSDFLSLIHTCVPRHLLNCFDTVVKFGRFSTKGDFRGFWLLSTHFARAKKLNVKWADRKCEMCVWGLY
jgi:hypothetical protein